MSRGKNILLLAAALGLLAGAAAINPRLRARREAAGLTQARPEDNAPPLVVLTTVAFGGFRGILADLLWLRASNLQDEGRYFELVQLADWITKLEPRFADVWIFHGWNLAYNVSVQFNRPADRWRWVRQGISLLRDRGLLYNADNAQMYHELGWFFQHKMGGSSDNAHRYYKQRWGEEMTALFGGARPDFAALPAETRARMRETYGLDADVMRRVDEDFGPFDWRLPQAHAAYWAWRGLQVAKGFDAVQARRMIFQSTADAFREGSLYVLPDASMIVTAPNLDLWRNCERAYARSVEEEPTNGTFRTAHRNFLLEATMLMYCNNRREAAQTLFDILAEKYPGEETAGGLASFAYRALAPTLRDLSDRDATFMLQGFWIQSYYWLAIGDEERARGFDQMARLAWKVYMDKRSDPEFKTRTGLPPIPQMRRVALEEFRKQWAETPFAARAQQVAEDKLPPAEEKEPTP